MFCFTLEKDKDPPIMALSGPIIMRSLAQRMRRDLKKNGFLIVWIIYNTK